MRFTLGTDGEKTPILLDFNVCACELNSLRSICSRIKVIKNPIYILVSGDIFAITSPLLFAVKKGNRFAFKETKVSISTIPKHPFIQDSVISGQNNFVYRELSENCSLDKDKLHQLFIEEENTDNFNYDLDDLVNAGEVKIINDLTEIYDL